MNPVKFPGMYGSAPDSLDPSQQGTPKLSFHLTFRDITPLPMESQGPIIRGTVVVLGSLLLTGQGSDPLVAQGPSRQPHGAFPGPPPLGPITSLTLPTRKRPSPSTPTSPPLHPSVAA